MRDCEQICGGGIVLGIMTQQHMEATKQSDGRILSSVAYSARPSFPTGATFNRDSDRGK